MVDYKIIDARGAGKTSRLMLIAKDTNAIIVCQNPFAMSKKAENYGIIGLDFIDYYDFLSGNYDCNRKILIDEIEELVTFIDKKVIGYSLTVE